ncbi:MAG TPA: hypothetical protein VND93_21030 [Myxococcales bacterium]|nr:hypothetical protein [Myxococcales bacterium]
MRGAPLAQTLDATCRSFTDHLPPAMRSYASTLPHRLGLTPDPHGRWEDFWVLAINRDLPGYAADDPDRPAKLVIPARVLERFRAAHHCAIVHCLIADRLVDRQVMPDLHMVVLRDLFLQLWEHQLCEAMDDQAQGRGALAVALVALRRGTQQEIRCIQRRALDAATYAVQTRDKLRWGSTAAASMLRMAGHPGRAVLLERAYDRFCFALQCLDDALDCEEDQATRGMTMPSLLGVPEGALVRAVPPILDSAIRMVEEARLPRLSGWMRSFQKLASRIRPGGRESANLAQGRKLAAAADEVL